MQRKSPRGILRTRMDYPGFKRNREEKESWGRLYVFDAEGILADSGIKKLSRRTLDAAMARIRSRGFDQILLYNFSTRPQRLVLECVGSASASGFDVIKVEVDVRDRPMADFIEAIMGHGAAEVHLAMPPIRAVQRAGSNAITWGKALSVLRVIYSEIENTKIPDIRVKALLPASVPASETMFRSLASAGARHIMAQEVPNRARVISREALISLCGKLADENDVTIELRFDTGEHTFRSLTRRTREAEDLLLDIPYAYLAGEPVPLGAVFQLGFRCNQHCVFCTSDCSLPEVPQAVVLARLEDVLERGVPRVVFTGGEPTLNRSLINYIARCKQAGVPEVSVYSNGMNLASRQYASELAGAGVDLGLISLHSASPAVSDAVTRCPGGFRKTVAGIHNLLETRTLTIISYVINSLNYRETPRFASFVKDRFPGACLNLSYVSPIMDAAASLEIVPRFTDAAPWIMETLDACAELGLVVADLEPKCGIPPCVMRNDKRYYPLWMPLSERLSGYIKPPACGTCSRNASCPGIHRRYAKLYGASELSPLP